MDASTLLKNLKIKDLDAGEVFSNRPSGTVVRGYDRPSAYTPAIDPGYVFQESSRDIIVWLLNPGEPLYANEVRKLFMGESSSSNLVNAIEVTFSTRSLLRWAELTVRFQPLARQGIQPVAYALDRALAYRACRETRAMLHELAQRLFPPHEAQHAEEAQQDAAPSPDGDLTGSDGVKFLLNRLQNLSTPGTATVHLRKISSDGRQSKDWICEVRPNGMELCFGRAGAINNRRFFAADTCRNDIPVDERSCGREENCVKGTALSRN